MKWSEKKMETIEDEKKTQRKVRPPNNLKSAIGTVVTLLILACIVLVFLWLITWLTTSFNGFYLFSAIALFFIANCVNSIQVVQPPEIWIIERNGKFSRKFEPGLHWPIPWFDFIRDKLSLAIQWINALRSRDKNLLIDTEVEVINPRLYFQIDGARAELVIYSFENGRYKDWLEGKSGPIIRRYLRSNNTNDVIDEGAGGGDLVERLKERPGIMRKKIKQKQELIEEISKTIKKPKDKKRDSRLLESTNNRLKDTVSKMQGRLASLVRVKSEWINFEEQACIHGFKRESFQFTIGEYVFPRAIIEAREELQKAEKEATAAVDRAITEAIMRVEPIVQTKDRLEQIGFSKKAARENALRLEIIETLAEKRSLFLTSGGELDFNAIAASVAAIFQEVPQRRKEAETGSKAKSKT